MDNIQEAIESIILKRSAHLEMYAAAFIKEVGSEKASQYELVEQRSDDGLITSWYFRKSSQPLSKDEGSDKT